VGSRGRYPREINGSKGIQAKYGDIWKKKSTFQNLEHI
jgi:hypothetical protein